MTEPLPKSWWVAKENRITEDDSPSEIERKKLYAKLCADKKPYFFAYVYQRNKQEYDTFMKNARSNAITMYKNSLDVLIEQYHSGQLTDEDAIRFVNNFERNLPLDMSPSTANRACWAIEKKFDGVDLFKDVVFNYSILKTGIEYDQSLYDVVKYICNQYKPSTQIAQRKAAIQYSYGDDEEDWVSIDMMMQNLVEQLYGVCPNEQILCEILIDLCYGENMSKQIVWRACEDEILRRLLSRNDNKMRYPKKCADGEFWCQGVKYTMQEITVGGDDDEEFSI